MEQRIFGWLARSVTTIAATLQASKSKGENPTKENERVELLSKLRYLKSKAARKRGGEK